jgi:hypothetical protein
VIVWWPIFRNAIFRMFFFEKKRKEKKGGKRFGMTGRVWRVSLRYIG